MSQQELLQRREQALLRGDLDTAEKCQDLIERGTVQAVLNDLFAAVVLLGGAGLLVWALVSCSR